MGEGEQIQILYVKFVLLTQTYGGLHNNQANIQDWGSQELAGMMGGDGLAVSQSESKETAESEKKRV